MSDEDELVRFVAGEYPYLVAALCLVCGDQSAAEDAVQEALARAVVAQRRGRIDSLPAWVRVVALNILRNRWRSQGRERKATQRLQDAHRARAAFDDVDGSIDLARAMGELTRRQREAVALHYRMDLSVAETAEAMNVSDGTVKTLLSRAREALAGILGEDGGDDD